MKLGISLKGWFEDNLFKVLRKKNTPKPTTKNPRQKQTSLYVGKKKNSTLESGTIWKNH